MSYISGLRPSIEGTDLSFFWQNTNGIIEEIAVFTSNKTIMLPIQPMGPRIFIIGQGGNGGDGGYDGGGGGAGEVADIRVGMLLSGQYTIQVSGDGRLFGNGFDLGAKKGGNGGARRAGGQAGGSGGGGGGHNADWNGSGGGVSTYNQVAPAGITLSRSSFVSGGKIGIGAQPDGYGGAGGSSGGVNRGSNTDSNDGIQSDILGELKRFAVGGSGGKFSHGGNGTMGARDYDWGNGGRSQYTLQEIGKTGVVILRFQYPSGGVLLSLG